MNGQIEQQNDWSDEIVPLPKRDSLAKEAAAAAQELRRYGVHHGGRPRRHAATGASDVAAPAKAARADPVRVWCVNHGERSHAPAMPGSLIVKSPLSWNS